MQRDHAMGAANDSDLSRRKGHAWRAAISAQQLSVGRGQIHAPVARRDSSTKLPAEIPPANRARCNCVAGCVQASQHRCSTPIRNQSTTTPCSVGRGTSPALRRQTCLRATAPRVILRKRRQIAQDWLDLRAERSLSSFDQRHLLNLQAQYTTGQGLEGGTLSAVGAAGLLKEWTLLTQLNVGTGMPETPVFPAAVPGTGWIGTAAAQPYRRADLRRAERRTSESRSLSLLLPLAHGDPRAEIPSPDRASSASTAPCSAHFVPASTFLSRCAHRRDQPAESCRSSAAGITTLRKRAIWPAASSNPMRSCKSPCELRF